MQGKGKELVILKRWRPCCPMIFEQHKNGKRNVWRDNQNDKMKWTNHSNGLVGFFRILPLIQTIADEDFFDEPEQSEEKKLKMEPSEHEIVTLSSDDEDDIVELGERIAQRPPAIGQAYTSYGRPISLSNRGRWGSHHEEVAQQNLRQQREFEKKRLRKRRNSGDLESKELTEGKLLTQLRKASWRSLPLLCSSSSHSHSSLTPSTRWNSFHV
ncbi:unnamed protein product, partial [Mesorhabditis belari]|uniref:Uncharacterized protein n=1 Tax=Mesorhabditis belari TaxID=2138241 RepID=A0AAF3FIT2_9BILA